MDGPELLKRCDAGKRDFRTADLAGSKLSELRISRANLSEGGPFGANLLNGDLGRAGLRGAYLEGADLSRANLSEADLSWTNLNSAKLEGTVLDRADLPSAQHDDATTWPEDFDVPDGLRYVSQDSSSRQTNGPGPVVQTVPES
jgi:uncharacterized protein YjbI with pentapeptide repeats